MGGGEEEVGGVFGEIGKMMLAVGRGEGGFVETPAAGCDQKIRMIDFALGVLYVLPEGTSIISALLFLSYQKPSPYFLIHAPIL